MTMSDRPALDAIELVRFHLNSGDSVFEGEVNKGALLVKDRAAYPWFYRIQMKALELDAMGLPTPRERRVLDTLFERIVIDLTKDYEVLVIGRNTVQGNHEIWLYTELMAGGVIADMKGRYPEEGGRFLRFEGLSDPTWSKVEGYLSMIGG